MASAKREAVILVRIDNMDTLTTECQKSIRFEIKGTPVNDRPATLIAVALAQAPDTPEWS